MEYQELLQLKDQIISLLKDREASASEALYISSEIALLANMAAMSSVLGIEE